VLFGGFWWLSEVLVVLGSSLWFLLVLGVFLMDCVAHGCK
jgi:hypothetical protein